MEHTLSDLEEAAGFIIRLMRRIPELDDVSIAIIGGLAVRYYLPGYRRTDNVNILVDASISPGLVRTRLLQYSECRLIQIGNSLWYQSTSGLEIEIHTLSENSVPYLPDSARPVRDLPSGFIPYVSLLDLIVFKIDSSGLYRNLAPRMRDALDAAALLEHAARHQPLRLSYRKERIIRRGLPDAIEYSGREWGWWYRRLGFDGYSRRHSHTTLLSPNHYCRDLKYEYIWDDHLRDACLHDFPCTPHRCPRHGHGPCGPDYQGPHHDPTWKRRQETLDLGKGGPHRIPSSKSDPCLSKWLNPDRLEKSAPETHVVYRITRSRALSPQAKRPAAFGSGKKVYEMSGALAPPSSRGSSPPPGRRFTSMTTTYVVRGRRTASSDARLRAARPAPPPPPTHKAAAPSKTSSGGGDRSAPVKSAAHASRPPASSGGGRRTAPTTTAATTTTTTTKATPPVVPTKTPSEQAGIRDDSNPAARSDDRARPAAGKGGSSSSSSNGDSKTAHRRVWAFGKNSGSSMSCFTGSSNTSNSEATVSDSIKSFVRTRPPEVVFAKAQKGDSVSVGKAQQAEDGAASSSKKVRFILGSR